MTTSIAPIIWKGDPLTGAITGSPNDDEYVGGLAGTSPYGIDSLKVFDVAGNASVTARLSMPPGAAYFGAAVRDSLFEFGDGVLAFDARTTSGHYPFGIVSSVLKHGGGPSDVVVKVEEGIYAATGIGESQLLMGSGADNVSVDVIWSTEVARRI